jgi:methyl-accepting chemotaxis protein
MLPRFLENKTVRALAASAEAIGRSQAVIEFELDGTIVTANPNFLGAVGYSLDEIQGKNHSMFVAPDVQEDAEYRCFWAKLGKGEFQTGQFKRIGKGGREIWIQASYNPVLDRQGKPIGVIKFATDITSERLRRMEADGKIAAIERAQAVIEFDMSGTIITANENFLGAVGYSLHEIQGRHHRMFVPPAEAESDSYRSFWERLGRGDYQAGEFKRLGEGGREIWILATYNPILDERGKPFKVVKFATDVTTQKLIGANNGGQIEAIEKSLAVIEFEMDGTIIKANKNFLDAVGYSLEEIVGKHHSLFVEPAEKKGSGYADFWASLNRGEYQAAEYKRIAKGGREIWIQASYNPILNLDGEPFKVVKYATDTTAMALGRKKAARARALIDSVAAGSEEMSASIREISETMAKSRDTASAAALQVRAADTQAQRLNAAASAMGGIVELISIITSRINLLALNATIESARAGEAGRGFAIVASEVKNLATQAKQATEKVGAEIENLNGVSSDVVSALAAIATAIASVNEYVNSTAAAVEEQSAVTSDMSVNMQRAAAELA